MGHGLNGLDTDFLGMRCNLEEIRVQSVQSAQSAFSRHIGIVPVGWSSIFTKSASFFFKTMTRLLITVFAALALNTALAQQDPFAEMQRRMLDMQRRMMQQLQGGSWGNGSLQQDTSFFFRFDTSFSTEGGSGRMQFFRSSPFGWSRDSSSTTQGMGDFWGFDQMFEDFFNLGSPRGGFDMGDYRFPSDDGNLNHQGDNLLPEERLRQQEERAKQKPPKKPAPAEPKGKDKKPKIETIRI